MFFIVILMAVVMPLQLIAGDFVPVNLEKYFNNCGTAVGTADETYGFDFVGSSYAGDPWPEKGTKEFEGIPFLFPTGEQKTKNNVSAESTVIQVPKGKYGTIYFLGSSTNGSYIELIMLKYSDGSETGVVFALTDWCKPPEFGEKIAVSFPYRINKTKKEEIANYIFLQGIACDPNRELVSLTTSDNFNVHIFAMTLSSDRAPQWVTERVIRKKEEKKLEEYTKEQIETRELVMKDRKPMEVTFGFDFSKSDRNADRAAKLCKQIGVTGVEHYIHILWDVVEPKPDEFDWKNDDRRVKILKENGLGWEPFIILGPWYSMPEWFRKSEKNYPFVCLEHNQQNGDQSLWSPYIRAEIDRFMKIFAERYRKEKVINRVLLGVSGDYGESIYPVHGNWDQNYHTHQGYWCGDENAKKDFRKFLKEKYSSVGNLNSAWKTQFADFEEINPKLKKDIPSARQWLDQMDWYRKSMTDFTEFWVATARKHFPDEPVYICTGGSDHTALGSDFAAQVKMAKKYNAGMRITNEGSDYASNFRVTRQVASASQFYNTYFGYEPASKVTEKGIVARIFGSAAAGADELHEYGGNAIIPDSGKPRPQATEAFYHYNMYLTKGTPLIDIAVFCPRTHYALDDNLYGQFYSRSGYFRDYYDHDYVDELMVLDGALSNYKILVMLSGYVTEQAVWNKIRDWVKNGGVFVTFNSGNHLQTPEGNTGAQKDILGFEEIPSEIRAFASGTAFPNFRLDVGFKDDEIYLSGDWNGPEGAREDSHWRWSGKASGFKFIVNPSKSYIFRINGSFPADGTLMLGNKEIGEISKDSNEFRLKSSDFSGKSEIELIMKVQTWVPAEKTPGSTDKRNLGIMVQSVELIEAGQENSAQVNQKTVKSSVDLNKLAGVAMRPSGKGYTAFYPGNAGDNDGYFSFIRIIKKKFGLYPEIDGVSDGIFAALQKDRMLFYNSKESRMTKEVVLTDAEVTKARIDKPVSNKYKIELEPHSVGCILFSRKEPVTLAYKFTDEKTAPAMKEAYVKLATKNEGSGLSQSENPDGATQPEEKDGKKCRMLIPNQLGGNRYLYFKTEPPFSAGKKIEIEIEYFDEGSGTVKLQYDSAEGPWKESAETIELEGSKGWKKFTFKISDADFKKRCNGCDFRFDYPGDLCVAAVRVMNKEK